jgi:hypothetical protein
MAGVEATGKPHKCDAPWVSNRAACAAAVLQKARSVNEADRMKGKERCDLGTLAGSWQ